MILDKLPLKKTIIIISSVGLISSICIMMLFHLKCKFYLELIYVFRGIFGITGEGLCTIEALLIAQYGGKYYDTLMGVGLCLPFFLDAVSVFVTPIIYSKTRSM